ncbi:MAG: NUDIX domain-containing protein [Simkaniaceae bacterium]|nr:NUDIX domain-containing protein [Candidatus Sacchlamyda saccharinae]
MERQFTSTCYILDQDKFLLIFHEKHQKWLPPGGHLEENETPPETAVREVLEETGLEIEFVLEENIWVDDWNAKSIPRPFSVLLENIAAKGDEPAHQHIDFVYVAKPNGGTLHDGKWFTLEEVEALETHKEIFADTQKTIRKLAQDRRPSPKKHQTFQRADQQTPL